MAVLAGLALLAHLVLQLLVAAVEAEVMTHQIMFLVAAQAAPVLLS